MSRAKGRSVRFVTGGQNPDPRLTGKWDRADERRARKLAKLARKREQLNDEREKGST